jgi:hypothetical protein
MKTQFIKPAAIKRLAKQRGKRIGKDFLAALDGHLERKVEQALEEHNGGRKTLDAAVFGYIFGR